MGIENSTSSGVSVRNNFSCSGRATNRGLRPFDICVHHSILDAESLLQRNCVLAAPCEIECRRAYIARALCFCDCAQTVVCAFTLRSSARAYLPQLRWLYIV